MSRRGNVQRPIGDDWKRLYRIATRAAEHDDLLDSDHEWRFVNQMVERLEKWQDKAFVSLKQMQWLHRIDERLDRENVDTAGLKPVTEVLHA